MKRVPRWQTSDGVLHDTPKKATLHADHRYGSALTRMAGNLLNINKYKLMTSYLDEHLEDFRELLALKADITLEEEPDNGYLD